MALPASDNFNRANSATLGTASSGFTWTDQNVGCGITSNQATASNNGSQAMDGSNTYSNDQFAQVTLVTLVAGGPSVRCSGTNPSENQYLLQSAFGIYKNVADTTTQIATVTSAYANGDVAKISVTGTSIAVFKNGSANGTVTDAALASGSAGINMGIGDVFDTWSGDNAATNRSFLLTKR